MSNNQWLSDLIARLQDFLPQLLAAALLLLGGWVLALLLRFLAGRLSVRVLERARRNADLKEAVEGPAVSSTIPRVVAGFVFWVTLLFFVSAALESVGFAVVTDVLNEVAYYLPNVLAAFVIVLVGVIVSRLARRAVTAGARTAGVLNAERIGRAAQVLVFTVALVVALDQIGIQAQLLVVLLTVFTGAALGSAGLAFGMGAKDTVGNIIASHYFTQTYRTGQIIRLGDIEGEIVQTTPTAVILATREGRMAIPARKFSEEASLLLTQG